MPQHALFHKCDERFVNTKLKLNSSKLLFYALSVVKVEFEERFDTSCLLYMKHSPSKRKV